MAWIPWKSPPWQYGPKRYVFSILKRQIWVQAVPGERNDSRLLYPPAQDHLRYGTAVARGNVLEQVVLEHATHGHAAIGHQTGFAALPPCLLPPMAPTAPLLRCSIVPICANPRLAGSAPAESMSPTSCATGSARTMSTRPPGPSWRVCLDPVRARKSQHREDPCRPSCATRDSGCWDSHSAANCALSHAPIPGVTHCASLKRVKIPLKFATTRGARLLRFDAMFESQTSA